MENATLCKIIIPLYQIVLFQLDGMNFSQQCFHMYYIYSILFEQIIYIFNCIYDIPWLPKMEINIYNFNL